MLLRRASSGTDARVDVCIYGANGDSGDVVLESGSDDFERGAVDTFGIETVDLVRCGVGWSVL